MREDKRRVRQKRKMRPDEKTEVVVRRRQKKERKEERNVARITAHTKTRDGRRGGENKREDTYSHILALLCTAPLLIALSL